MSFGLFDEERGQATAASLARLLPAPHPARGERSSSLKLLTQRLAGDADPGDPGTGGAVPVRTPRGVVHARAAMPAGGDRVDGYVERELRVTVPR